MQTCGICKRAPRVGEGHHRIRLEAADMKEMKLPENKEPGLYQCCSDCFKEYLPVVASRHGKKPEEMPQNLLV